MILMKGTAALLYAVSFASVISFVNGQLTCTDIGEAMVDNFCKYTIPSVCSGTNPVTQFPQANQEISAPETIDIRCASTNADGSPTTCTTTIEVKDNTPPEPTCISDRTVEVDENCEATIPKIGPDEPFDNCDATGGQNPSINEIVDTIGTYTIEYSARDTSGNTASCTTQLTTRDATSPEVECINDDELMVDEFCQAEIPLIGTASDNCDAAPTTEQSLSEGFLVSTLGITTVTFNAIDGSGNENSCRTIFEVKDEILPEVTCIPETELQANEQCQASIPEIGRATDNCNIATNGINQVPRQNEMAPKGTTTVTYSARDGSGNEASCTTDIVVADNSPPEVTCIRTQRLTADENCEASVPDIGTAEDNCDVPDGQQIPTANTPISGEISVVYTAMDNSGNTATCTTDIIVVDDTFPEVTCMPDQALQVDESCQVGLPYIGSASDNCGAPEEEQTPGENTIVGLGRTRVNYSAKDESDNTSRCSTLFTVVDVSAPEVTCIVDQELKADDRCQARIPKIGSATDNCDTPIVSQSPRDNTIANVGETDVIFDASDSSGNMASCSTRIRVVDDIPPSVDCIADQELKADDNCNARVPVIGSATDNCGVDPDIVQSPPSDSTLELGAQLVTYSRRDESGNSASCTTRLTVIDETPPEVTCSRALDIYADENCRARLLDVGAASDNCFVRSSDQSPPQGTSVTLGDYPITYSATDSSGNTASCNTRISVLDNTPPIVTCINDEVRYVDDNCETTLPSIGTATDNCGEPVGIQNPREGVLVTVGEELIRYTATDTSGFLSSCATLITVRDNIAPEVFCIEPRELEVDGNCNARVPNILSSGRDNCGTPLGEQNPAAQSTVSIGETTINYILSDDSGNTASCTTPITVVDKSAPTVTCFQGIDLVVDENCRAEIPSVGIGSDNCEFDTSQIPRRTTLVPIGETRVTFTAIDGSGNSDSCETTVTARDITPPEVICPKRLEVQANKECQAVIPEIGQVNDNCGRVKREQFPPAGTLVSLGETVITLTGIDEAGNTLSCNTVFTVADTRPLEVNCIADTIIEADEFCQGERISIGSSSLSDSCGSIEYSQDLPTGTYTGLGTETITLTGFDIFNPEEMVSCSTDVTVVDRTPPVQDDEEAICLWPPNKNYYCEDLDNLLAGTDNCGPVNLTYVHCGSEHMEYLDPCHHLDDCFLNEGRVCFRAGNLGTLQTSYTLAGIVVDSAGNEAVFERDIYVPVNGSDVDLSQCITATEVFDPFYDKSCGKDEPVKHYEYKYDPAQEPSVSKGAIEYPESNGQTSSKGESGGSSMGGGGTSKGGTGGSSKGASAYNEGEYDKDVRTSRKGKGRGKNSTKDSRGGSGHDSRPRTSNNRSGKTGRGRNKRTGRGRGTDNGGYSDDGGTRGRGKSRKGRGSRS